MVVTSDKQDYESQRKKRQNQLMSYTFYSNFF